MGITVLDGDFQTSDSICPDIRGIKYFSRQPGHLFPSQQFAEVEKLEFVQENASGGGFSPLWGAIGDAAIGPAGLLLGADAKKPKQTVYFKCTLKDGRWFVGSTSAKEYQNWRNMVNNPQSDRNARLFATVFTICVMVGIPLYLMYLGSGPH